MSEINTNWKAEAKRLRVALVDAQVFLHNAQLSRVVDWATADRVNEALTTQPIRNADIVIAAEDAGFDSTPSLFRIEVAAHPNGSGPGFMYGCYFPGTDLSVTDMGGRGTGRPQGEKDKLSRFGKIEWMTGIGKEWK